MNMENMLFGNNDKIYIHFSLLPKVWLDRFDEISRLAREYPEFMPEIPQSKEQLRRNMPQRYHAGVWRDEWNCIWENITDGCDAICTGHPLPNREDILTLKIPEMRGGNLPHGFMYLRLLDLRGFEEAMVDFAEECDELQILIDKVLEYNCIQMRDLMDKGVRSVRIGDDLGMQNGLAIGPEKWRKYLKPCFKKIFGIAKAAGATVYFHTDGCIHEIMPDIAECGADIINPQFRANGLDNLVAVCRGKIAIDLDLDRQMFPFVTPSQLDDHMRNAIEALWTPRGGLSISVEIGHEVPTENIAALLQAGRRYQYYKG